MERVQVTEPGDRDEIPAEIVQAVESWLVDPRREVRLARDASVYAFRSTLRRG